MLRLANVCRANYPGSPKILVRDLSQINGNPLGALRANLQRTAERCSQLVEWEWRFPIEGAAVKIQIIRFMLLAALSCSHLYAQAAAEVSAGSAYAAMTYPFPVSKFVFSQEGRKAAATIPSARLVEFNELGHAPHVEAPERFLDAVVPFLMP